MCGIVGYVGPREAAAVLVEGLSRLEYRGYDSAGVAVLNGRGVETRKLAGRIAGLREVLSQAPLHGSCGLGPTRWATTGSSRTPTCCARGSSARATASRPRLTPKHWRT